MFPVDHQPEGQWGHIVYDQHRRREAVRDHNDWFWIHLFGRWHPTRATPHLISCWHPDLPYSTEEACS